MVQLRIFNPTAKAAQLRRIEWTLHAQRSARSGFEFGPRALFSLACAIGALFMAFALLGCLSSVGFRLTPDAAAGIPIAMFLLVFALGCRFGNLPATWSAKLDLQLARYAMSGPVNREAFRALQQRTRERGSLESVFVAEWLEQERQAIEWPETLKRPQPKTFLDQQV